MRFKGRMELEHGLKTIDIAPLINVFFVLLIFVMLTSTFVMQSGIRVSLPRAVTGEAVKAQVAEVIISAEDVLYFNGKVTSMEALKPLLRQIARKNQAILIKADKRANLGRVVEIWDLCRDQGVTALNLATN